MRVSQPVPVGRPTDLLAVVGRAMGLLRRSDPSTFMILMATMLASGLLVGPRLIGVRDLLAAMTAPQRSAADFVLPVVLVAGSTVIMETASSLRPHLERLLDAAVSSTASRTILDVTGRSDFAAFEDPDFHDALDRATRGAELRPVQVVQGVTAVVSATAGAITLLIAVLTSSVLVAGLLCAAYLPVLLVQLRSGSSYYAVNHRNTAQDRMRGYLMRLLTNRITVAELRFHGSDRHLAQRVAESWHLRLTETRTVVRQRMRRTALSVVVAALGTVAAASLLIWLFLEGRLTVATAGVLVIAIWELGSGLSALGWGIANLRESALFLADYVSFAAMADRTPPGPVDGPGPRPLPEPGPHPLPEPGPLPLPEPVEGPLPRPDATHPITLRGVGFCYPTVSRPTLVDIDFTVAPGEVVAIVGPTGAGKTTLAKVLTGLYAPTSGHLVWAGEVLTEERHRLTRNRISVMTQDFGRYSLSVRENIALTDLDRRHDDAALVTAARAAGIHDVIAGLADQYDTRLGVEFEGGVDLSVGQWQRLALARSLFAPCDLLVLDEPTSALDPQTERAFVGELRRASTARAVVIISHRFSTVADVDRIYVVDGGRIVEQGPHDRLIRSDGLYRQLFGRDAVEA